MLSLIIHKLVKVFALFHQFPPFFHLFETKESIAWCFLVDRKIFFAKHRNYRLREIHHLHSTSSPGLFSQKMGGKSPGDEVASTHCVTDVRRRNLRSASDVSETFLFWAPNGLNQSWELRFEFLFNLIGNSRMAFLNLVHRWEPRTRGISDQYLGS